MPYSLHSIVPKAVIQIIRPFQTQFYKLLDLPKCTVRDLYEISNRIIRPFPNADQSSRHFPKCRWNNTPFPRAVDWLDLQKTGISNHSTFSKIQYWNHPLLFSNVTFQKHPNHSTFSKMQYLNLYSFLRFLKFWDSQNRNSFQTSLWPVKKAQPHFLSPFDLSVSTVGARSRIAFAQPIAFAQRIAFAQCRFTKALTIFGSPQMPHTHLSGQVFHRQT